MDGNGAHMRIVFFKWKITYKKGIIYPLLCLILRQYDSRVHTVITLKSVDSLMGRCTADVFISWGLVIYRTSTSDPDDMQVPLKNRDKVVQTLHELNTKAMAEIGSHSWLKLHPN